MKQKKEQEPKTKDVGTQVEICQARTSFGERVRPSSYDLSKQKSSILNIRQYMNESKSHT